ncbi:MAG: dihydrolipoyl dehydrogenase [Pseudobdellovibrionaceae bacterium]|nr:dihydrolipoyl dehydrogenase [Bdellovibrionales bacterium]USN47974.1 MAG: dihydrolipoyl dehydrogenase [Pseudobdellovibrionaceae bacterium]
MSQNEFDVIFIGSGPGGYVGAIRAAQLGLNTAVIEKDKTFGGTCLNVGCIPSKALLESSEHFLAAQEELGHHGVNVGSVSLDLSTMLKRKDKIVEELTTGIDYLFKKNKITAFQGTGKFKGPHEVEVTDSAGKTQTLVGKNIVIATGSVPRPLPGLDVDGKHIITSTEALSLPAVPEHMVVVGAGAIGLEMGSVWGRLGAKVTVVEYGSKICGPMDAKLSKRLQQILSKQGFTFELDAKVSQAKVKGSTVTVSIERMKKGDTLEVKCDVVLVAAGRAPYTKGLGLENVGLSTNDRGVVEVDRHWRTSQSHIYAIGDVIPGPMLAHKAEEEGVAVAEIIAGKHGHVNYETVPSVIYTWPEFASVGKTEEELKAAGVSFNVGTFPFTANGRAKALGHTEGQVKILADKTTDRILGAHIVGPRASDLLGELVVAMEFAGSSEDVALSFHAHPTLSEVIREAALAVSGRARQM